MAKKVTLRKRCGKNDCEDPNCDYIIVEDKGVSYAYKRFKELIGINDFMFIGWCFFVGPPLIFLFLYSIEIIRGLLS